MAQLAAVDVDIADLVGPFDRLRTGSGQAQDRLEALALSAGSREMPWRWRQRCRALRLRLGMLSFRQPRTSSSGSSVFCRKATTMASSAGVNWRQRRALRRLGSHRHVGPGGPLAPLRHRLRVQPVAGGKGPGAFLRRLERGSKTRRRAGDAVKNASHRASSS